jgi:hypothetical protein
VGDYSRRLAGELIRQGHPSVAVALNDSHISEMLFESQEIEGTSISLLRLPNVLPWSNRMIVARDWLDGFNPDWTSLQFVPFGFHRKGLCFGLGKWLEALTPKASWHVMFHELWLGLDDRASVKHRIWGALQRSIILDVMGRLRVQLVHTQAETYREALKRENIRAPILPLFSNIPYVSGDGWNSPLEPLITEAVGKRYDRKHLYLAGVLGMVHPEWSAERAVNTLLPLVRRSQKRLVLVFHGRNNLTPEAISKLKFTLHGQAHVVLAGERTTVEISKILQTLDLGLATTPRQNIQKSGSVAAMLEHGLRVLVTRDDWSLRGAKFHVGEASSRLLSSSQFAALEVLPARDLPASGHASVKGVADRMLGAMKAALASRGPEALTRLSSLTPQES